MADNISVFTAAGTSATVATDDISSVHHPRQKLIFGPDGTNSGDVAKTNGLPVQQAQPSSKAATTTVAYGTFTGSMANLSITGVSGKTRMWVWNDTDAAIGLSEDGGTTQTEIVPPKSNGYIDLLSTVTAIWGKYLSAPTVGNVYFRPEA